MDCGAAPTGRRVRIVREHGPLYVRAGTGQSELPQELTVRTVLKVLRVGSPLFIELVGEVDIGLQSSRSEG